MANKKIALLDCDGGSGSIASWIKSGKVQHFPAATFQDAEKAFFEVLKNRNEYSRFVVDAWTRLSALTLSAVIVSPEKRASKSIWNMRDELKVQRQHWLEMSNMMLDFLNNIQHGLHPIPVVIICHEGERESPTDGTTMYGPDLNRALIRGTYEMSDCVVRIGRAPQDVTIDGKKYPRGTRVLRTEDTAQYMAKMRADVDGPKVPALIAEPTFSKFLDLVQPPLTKILLYGPSGAGKTTFACSE